MKNLIFSVVAVTIPATTITTAFAEGSHQGGNANAHWMAPAADAKKPNPVKSDPASIDRGKKTYFQNCASCHGAKAKGDGPASAALNPKPADLSMMSGMHPDGDFAWKITNGRGAMPAWKGTLSENKIWELVNYIQNLNPGGKKKMMNMKGMDHSKMSMEEMQKMMKKNMPGMDHSKMNMQDMQKMMGNMKMGQGNMDHSNGDSHHDTKPKKMMDDHDKPHNH